MNPGLPSAANVRFVDHMAIDETNGGVRKSQPTAASADGCSQVTRTRSSAVPVGRRD